jgi:hypothetical protein
MTRSVARAAMTAELGRISLVDQRLRGTDVPVVPRIGRAIGLAIATALAVPPLVLADAVPPSGGGPPPVIEPFDPLDPFLVSQLILPGLIVVAALVAWRRPAWRRRIAAIVTGLLLGTAGLFLIVVGLFFADWTGGHRVSVPAVIVGIVIAGAGILGATLIGRRAARQPAETPNDTETGPALK